MVGVDCGSLYRRTHSLSRLVWSWVGGRLAPFYINQMNRVDSCNGDMMTVRKHCLRIIITYYYYCISVKLHATVNAARCVCRSAEKRGCNRRCDMRIHGLHISIQVQAARSWIAAIVCTDVSTSVWHHATHRSSWNLMWCRVNGIDNNPPDNSPLGQEPSGDINRTLNLTQTLVSRSVCKGR